MNNNARLGVNDFDLWGRARGLMRADGSFGLPTEGSMVSFMIWLAWTMVLTVCVWKNEWKEWQILYLILSAPCYASLT